MTRGDRVRQLLRGTGQLLMTLGIIVLLFCVYELKITSIYTEHQQAELEKRLTRTWAAPEPVKGGKPVPRAVPALGAAFARIYLPTLGRDQEHVVVQGVQKADLKKGPGHYPGTAEPGAIGNLVISGHRTTYGAPFNRLDELKVGAPIVIETRDFYYTYLVTGTTIVAPTALGETDPVPNQPGVAPTQRILTLTTCNPKYSAKTRLIVRALLQSPLAKLGGALPPALVAAGYGRA